MMTKSYIERVKSTKEKHAKRQQEFAEKRQEHLDRMDYLDNLDAEVTYEINKKLGE